MAKMEHKRRRGTFRFLMTVQMHCNVQGNIDSIAESDIIIRIEGTPGIAKPRGKILCASY